MSEDPRMREIITPRAIEPPHTYVVKRDGETIFEGQVRHEAIQVYVASRRAIDDFDCVPELYRVRIWCDGAEFFCDQDSFPPRATRDRGKSCRQITGAVRPYPWERKMP